MERGDERTIKTNLDLSPVELTLYTYRNVAGTKFLSILRKGNLAFAASIERKEDFTQQYWDQVVEELSRMVCRSMNFYLHFGFAPDQATMEQRTKLFPERHYPLIYIVDEEVVNQ